MSLQALRRRTRGRSFRLRLGLIVAGVVALVVAGVWALFFSSWFAVTDVEVQGVSVLSTDDVLSAAAVRSGAPLIRLDGDVVSERVAALAPVDQVSVSRRWPHTVVISVVEREPVLAVPSDQGFALYDHEGVSYLEVIAVPDGVPTLTTEDPDDLAVQGVIETLGALPDALRTRLVTVRAETPDSIELDLTDGVVVVWGSADQSPRKAQVVVALMKQPGRVYIVSAPDAPAIRQ
jgi:cell division protein FtsQ